MAVVKDMALTLEGLLRDLEAALAGLDYRVEGSSRVEATNGTGRITITLANEMKRRGVEFGLISVCAQGGMGFAMVLEGA